MQEKPPGRLVIGLCPTPRPARASGRRVSSRELWPMTPSGERCAHAYAIRAGWRGRANIIHARAATDFRVRCGATLRCRGENQRLVSAGDARRRYIGPAGRAPLSLHVRARVHLFESRLSRGYLIPGRVIAL